jgi:hypothetical protein
MRFLLCWLGVMFVFFSLSSGKRGLYLLPAFPAAALLCGAWLANLGADAPVMRWTRYGQWIVVAALAGVALQHWIDPGLELGRAGQFEVPAWLAIGVMASCAAVAALHIGGLRRGALPRARIGLTIAGFAVLELALFTLVFPAIDSEKSPRTIAEPVGQLLSIRESVGVFRQHALAGGLEYYSDRRAIAIESSEELDAFLQAGGRIIVLAAEHLDQLHDSEASRTRSPIKLHAEARQGRRRLVAVELSRDGADTPSPAASRTPVDGRVDAH